MLLLFLFFIECFLNYDETFTKLPLDEI